MTWRILIEEIKRAVKGGNPSAPALWDEEIKTYAQHTLNTLLNTSYFQTVLPDGETIPDGYVLAVYTECPVEKWNKKSRAKMPAYPVRLPKNMGVFLVAPDGDEESQFIPIPAGQSGFIKKQGLISDLLKQTGYEVKDGYVVFTKEVPHETVQMHLVVADFSKYGDEDLLPVPAELFKTVVDEVVKMFIQQPNPDKIVDSGSEPTKFIK